MQITIFAANLLKIMMDKNSLIGFGLLMVLLIGYVVYNQQAEMKFQAQKKKDSIAYARLHPAPIQTLQHTKPNISDTSLHDTILSTPIVAEKLSVIENKDLIVTLTNKGGFPVKIELKKFKTFDGKPLLLCNGEKNNFDFSFKSNAGNLIHTKAESFTPSISQDASTIEYVNDNFQIQYSLADAGYLLHIKATPLQASPSTDMHMEWNNESLLTERDIESQKLYTQVCYNLENDGYDYFTIKEKGSKNLKETINWLSFKQHYFNTTLIADRKQINAATIQTTPTLDTAKKTLSAMNASFDLQKNNQYEFDVFAGPNDYKLLKSYNKGLEEIIPLHYGIFGFVKYINTWIIIPVFNFLAKMFSNYGIVILLLTFIIRLLMSPFTYKSYVSSAKMKALKPEMDELKEKYGDDKQAFGVEQMKLYREAGVNPLGGCMPALLQLPVFFALLSFFPQSIELRQSSFLWAKDLSTYDSILNLPFSIPFYGDHVSLFTILFVITSLLMALYSMNMNMGADQSNPMMKYLPFIMPVMFLGIFNKLPAALTFYYFVSNVITLGLQFVIQNYIIDPDKIHAQIQAKRNEPPKENKLMQRMMEMQKAQQERVKNSTKK